LAALHYDKRDMKESFAEYRVSRSKRRAAQVTDSRTMEDRGMHKERRPETLETVAKMFAGHESQSLSADRADSRIARENRNNLVCLK
jgi:hypothetical protein